MAIVIQKRDPITAPQTYHLKLEDYFGFLEPYTLSGQIVDVDNQDVFSGRLHIIDGRIRKIERCYVPEMHYILPGFVDAYCSFSDNFSFIDLGRSLMREFLQYGTIAVLTPNQIEPSFDFFFNTSDQDLLKNIHRPSDVCEAEELIYKGGHILITADDCFSHFDMLHPLINRYPHSVMLASGDSQGDIFSPFLLVELLKRGLLKGLNFYNLVLSISSNTINHFGLSTSLLRENDAADCIIVDNLKELTVLEVYKNGLLSFSKE